MVKDYVSKKLTANIAEQQVTLDAKGFYLISNESANVVTINMDEVTTGDNAIEIGAGKSLENFKTSCKELYYKAAANGSTLQIIASREPL